MTRQYLILLLALFSLACGISTLPEAIPTPIPATQTHSKPSVVLTATVLHSIPEITITGDVYLRDYSDIVRGSLDAGATVSAYCGLNICYLQDGSGLTFWRGCSSEAEGRGCEDE